MVAPYRIRARLVEADQFHGLADMLRIRTWMEHLGSPVARTGGVYYRGPEMVVGEVVVHPGDWVVHDGDEWLVCRHNRFPLLYEGAGPRSAAEPPQAGETP
jgi:hypothetical protein